MKIINASTSRATKSRRRHWAIPALLIGMLLAATSAPVMASDNSGPRWSNTRYSHSGGYGKNTHAGRKRYLQRQYDRGYEAGRRAGWDEGYHDGIDGHEYYPAPGRMPKRSSRFYARGFKNGFEDAYERGFHRGRHERRHRQRDRWGFEWRWRW